MMLTPPDPYVSNFSKKRFSAVIFLLTIISTVAHAKEYYVKNPSCPKGTREKTELIGEVHRDLLPQFDRDQGNTGTCGYHAAMVLLNAVYKALHPGSKGD